MQDKQSADLYFQQGQFQDAYKIYSNIYSNIKGTNNNCTTLLACMAQCQHRLNNLDKAESYYRESLRNNPKQPQVQFALGTLYLAKNGIEKAKKCFINVVSQQQGNAFAHANLGYIYRLQGNWDLSLVHLEKAATLKPKSAEIIYNLGISCIGLNLFDKAVSAFNKALELRPVYAEAYTGLGICHHRINAYTKAIEFFKKALSINSSCFDALKRIGFVLLDIKSPDEAMKYLTSAINMVPSDPELLCGLGQAYFQTGHLAKARVQYESVLFENKNNITAHHGLGELYINMGHHNEAIKHYQAALIITPSERTLISDYLMALNYPENLDRKYIFDEHIKRNIPSRSQTTCHRRQSECNKKPRIGYVSPDFRRHAVSGFFLPIIKNHTEKVETYCYSNTRNPDSTTEVIRSNAEHWRDVSKANDNDLTKLIEDDNIDILVDLSGHTSNSRLSVFFNHPGRVQVTYLGYPNTTGLQEIEYRITDKIADANDADQFYSESLIRLDGCFLCYEPLDIYPEIKDSPYIKNKHITFGCFNNLTKITDKTVELWCNLLKEIPGSKLIIKCLKFRRNEYSANLESILMNNGIKKNSFTLLPPEDNYFNHLNKYNDIDISLDTAPYNGTTTTFESLLMGVPVITITGTSHRSRVSTSILSNLGKNELIAVDDNDFIRIAKELTSTTEKLTEYKISLRSILLNSDLCNGKHFTDKLENALLSIILEYNT